MINNILFLPIIILIGFITSREDILTSKIRNRWVLTGLICPAIIYGFGWLLYILTVKQTLSAAVAKVVFLLIWNFDKWCINFVISVIVAYLLWHFKMWGAGDAKLFIAYTALIPMAQYHKIYFNYYFASFLLLLNIFIPATFFLFLKSLIHFIKRFNYREMKINIKKSVKEKIKIAKVFEGLKVLVGFFVLFLFFRVLNQESYGLMNKVVFNQDILILVSLLVFKPISKIFRKKSKITFAFFVVFIIYIIFKYHNSPTQYMAFLIGSLGRSFSVLFLFPIVNRIIDLYEENTAHKTMPFAIWMFLGVLITWFI